MTILEAIDTAIQNLEGVRLPVRDTGNLNRVAAALQLLDALKETVSKPPEETAEKGDDEP